ncbi:MAG TPA: TrkA family potassium uptake protein [Anaerolineae bacterium]|nr:TrkA family potassium uptake protein [Anaerolineae bacterium]
MKVVIAGGDPTGAQLASILLEQEHEICLVENRPEVLAQLHLELPTEVIYAGSAMDLRVLEGAGVLGADVLVASTSIDADNLVLCYLASTLYRVPYTVGQINNPRHAWLFDERLHVNVALNQSTILAHLIGEEMSSGDMMTLLKLRRGLYSLVEEKVHPESAAVGKAVRDLGLPAESVLCAVIRKDQLIIPRGDLVLQPLDEVLAVVHASQVAALADILGKRVNAR